MIEVGFNNKDGHPKYEHLEIIINNYIKLVIKIHKELGNMVGASLFPPPLVEFLTVLNNNYCTII